jgi:CBS domain-containing protein
MCIGKFCNRDVVCATRDSTVAEAAGLMRRHHVGDVIVVDETGHGRKPVGIVTDRDIVVEVVCANLDPTLVKVGDLLLQPLVTVDEQTAYADAVHLMATEGVRRMPVVNEAGLLKGIITLDDLFHQLAVPFTELSELAIRERRRETTTRV